ncbi:hypothetical protein QOZ94_001855 [Xanthobacter agilis]|uniref:Secreted protein n=1 Tax=Xanthobacter agilis TaxID=47492 RepID=A0ABU0LD71_XANAG|nr:hypothetical protein [Xanthobacter agilis]
MTMRVLVVVFVAVLVRAPRPVHMRMAFGVRVRTGGMGIGIGMGVAVRMLMAAVRSMHMLMAAGVGVRRMGMVLLMPIVLVPIMIVRTMIVRIVIVSAVRGGGFIGALFRTERALHRRGAGAKATHHVQEHMIFGEIDGVLGDLRRHMAIAEVPGHFHEAQRAMGAHLDQALRRGFDTHQPPVLQLHRIAVVEHGRLVEIEQEGKAPVGGEGEAAAMPGLMVEGQFIGHPLSADGGTADNNSGADHLFLRDPLPMAAYTIP